LPNRMVDSMKTAKPVENGKKMGGSGEEPYKYEVEGDDVYKFPLGTKSFPLEPGRKSGEGHFVERGSAQAALRNLKRVSLEKGDGVRSEPYRNDH